MKHLFTLFLLTLIASITVISCSDEKTTEPTTETEFIAEYSDFEGYRSWDKLAENTGPDPALGGFAHGDANTTRLIYVNDKNVKLENGEWPNGTILVKDMFVTVTGNLMGVMAMVKRGADFNTDHNGWEWFKLDRENGEIIERGANVNEDGCNSCHSEASNNDYSFTLMSE